MRASMPRNLPIADTSAATITILTKSPRTSRIPGRVTTFTRLGAIRTLVSWLVVMSFEECVKKGFGRGCGPKPSRGKQLTCRYKLFPLGLRLLGKSDDGVVHTGFSMGCCQRV